MIKIGDVRRCVEIEDRESRTYGGGIDSDRVISRLKFFLSARDFASERCDIYLNVRSNSHGSLRCDKRRIFRANFYFSLLYKENVLRNTAKV